MGLSPRTRGSHHQHHLTPPIAGPIPADAGEPTSATPSRPSRTAYPRGRGGAVTVSFPAGSLTGLSPRTRGSPPSRPCSTSRPGPIPADAGEPRAAARLVYAPRAYPRGRGGALKVLVQTSAGRGLSPRTRGSPGRSVVTPASQGPIPADAGEPGARRHLRPQGTAYPRGRGGAQSQTNEALARAGLSPRTRGSRAPSR